MYRIWDEIKNLTEKQKVFYTLGKKERFQVIRVNEGSLELEIGKQGTHINELRKDFESVWQMMVKQGYFEPMQIRDERDRFPFNRPAYIPAILAALPYVQVFRHGKRLALRLTQSTNE